LIDKVIVYFLFQAFNPGEVFGIETGKAFVSRQEALEFLSVISEKSCVAVDEIQRVFDLVRNTSDQLSERGHFLGLKQLFLRALKIEIRLLERLVRVLKLLRSPSNHVLEVFVQLLKLFLPR